MVSRYLRSKKGKMRVYTAKLPTEDKVTSITIFLIFWEGQMGRQLDFGLFGRGKTGRRQKMQKFSGTSPGVAINTE